MPCTIRPLGRDFVGEVEGLDLTRPLPDADIAAILREIALFLSMEDEPFKPRAYEKAAQSIEAADEPCAELFADGVAVGERIRTPEVTRAVSAVASNPLVRAAMVESQRLIAARHPRLVTEGRDQPFDQGTIALAEAQGEADADRGGELAVGQQHVAVLVHAMQTENRRIFAHDETLIQQWIRSDRTFDQLPEPSGRHRGAEGKGLDGQEFVIIRLRH